MKFPNIINSSRAWLSTTPERALDDAGIKFLTIRRRGQNIVERINAISDSQKRKVRVPAGDGQKSLLTVLYLL